MRANIEKGKLIAPKSLGFGLKRRKQLAYEIGRMERQLTERPGNLDWYTRAERALKMFKLELRLLDEWIDVRQKDSERLLREAFEMLKVMEGEIDFEPNELELIDRLEAFLDKEDEHKQVASVQ